jgi:hypothetical protein
MTGVPTITRARHHPDELAQRQRRSIGGCGGVGVPTITSHHPDELALY